MGTYVGELVEDFEALILTLERDVGGGWRDMWLILMFVCLFVCIE